ncbi:MAG: two-component hybrid sensor and regulator [Chthoniobacteraceae bacterium]|nr:two-component hybrid sensor and regulator [Chthoniobacteraceae bacterium]
MSNSNLPKQSRTRAKPKRGTAGPVTTTHQAKQFPIVGVGASAGGLEAFLELLKHLPADTGMGFVLVQHLDPQHESALTRLLARGTVMPVCEVTNNLRVEPNCVYVIPPNTQMSLAGGVLKLTPRGTDRGATRSIDLFFEALALDQREKAIGVVLSGTAMDGTLGLESIKAEGGVTFAQDGSAKYNSMPHSAIAAGCVDFVLSPEEIASELARIARHPLNVHDNTPPAVPFETAPANTRRIKTDQQASGQDGFKKILLLLRNHSGVDFSFYKSSTIQRRILRRLVLNKAGTLAEYALFLKDNITELDALYSDVLISVTSFFRNPDAFETLKRKVFPKLLAQQGRDGPMRIWALGCSTGQEPYSLAMAFAESVAEIPGAPKLQIFATDLNNALLDTARAGLYPKSLVQDISPERLQRFFVEEEGGYRVCKALREQVVFARQNVMSDPPFSRIDLITCRNVLIYFEAELQKIIIPAFHYALKPGGFLFLGASESIGQFSNLFAPADKKQKIFSRKAAPAQAFRLPLPGERMRTSPAGRRPAIPSGGAEAESKGLTSELDAQREADRISISQFAPPGVLINGEMQVVQFRGGTSAYLEPPTGKATFDVLKMARDGLMLPLRAAINRAKRENKPASRDAVRIAENGGFREITVQVTPLRNLKEPYFLVLFEEANSRSAGRAIPCATPSLRGKKEVSSRIAELELELTETRDYLQSIQEQNEAAHEELQASSEEGQSANEELQSMNEELETSKEELESTNEELMTINDEMVSRNTELSRLNTDLSNLEVNIHTAILLLAQDLTIRRFTPPAARIFSLIASDVGRPFGSIRHNLDVPDLGRLAAEVIDTVSVREREVQDQDGRWYTLCARPYLALDNRIDGVVLVLNDIDALKRSKQEISAAREYAEATLRTMPVPFLILRADLRVNSASDAFYNSFGVTLGETEGRLIYELGNRQWNIPQLRTLLEEILPQKRSFNGFEIVHDFPSIGRRSMLLNARRLEGQNSSPLILLSIEDVTERMESRAAMERSEIRYRRLFETSRDGILLLDPISRKITDANPFMTELLGYSREELLGRELWQIGLLEDERASQSAFRELQHKGSIRYEDLPLETKGGERREVEFVSNLYDEENLKVIQCNIRDITQRKLVERKFRGLLESAPDAMVITNPNGEIVLINSQTEKVFGYSRAELIGKRIEILIPVRYHQGHAGNRHDFMSAPRMRLMGAGMDLWALHKNGSEFPVEISLSPLETEGELLVTAAIRDVSARKTAEKSLRIATEEIARGARAKDDFLAMLSHELRTPLTPVLMTATALESDPELPEEVRDQLGMMRRNVELEARLIDDLLDLTRISRGKLQIAPVIADLHLLLDHTAEIVHSDGFGKQVRLIFKLEATRHHALVDPTRLHQVFWNLIKNAIKFTPTGGTVTVTTRNDSGGILVSIEDTGIGIGADALPHVFNAFEQGEVAGKLRYGGLGLGLAISKAVIALHGGTIRAESEGPGRGATFTVALAASDTPSPPAHAPAQHSMPARALKLLIVEDHEATRTVLSRLLTRIGHQVTTASSIKEALAAVATERFDALISDLGLPDGSGLELMREIQRRSPIPGIALSGYGMEDDLRQTKEAGFFAHLVKPVNLDQLRYLLDHLGLQA